jgi:hypothetical protein
MSDQIIPFPVLTMEAMSAPDWEPALTLKLPAKPSLELLSEARRQVVEYVDWYSNDAPQCFTSEEIRTEINRAGRRLIEICLAMPAAHERSLSFEIPGDNIEPTEPQSEPISDLWMLILADEPMIVTELEQRLEATQEEVVDHMIENTCWRTSLPAYTGRRGSAAQRLSALRNAYHADGGPQA